MDTKVEATVTWMRENFGLGEGSVVEGWEVAKLEQLLMEEQAGFSNKSWVWEKERNQKCFQSLGLRTW